MSLRVAGDAKNSEDRVSIVSQFIRVTKRRSGKVRHFFFADTDLRHSKNHPSTRTNACLALSIAYPMMMIRSLLPPAILLLPLLATDALLSVTPPVARNRLRFSLSASPSSSSAAASTDAAATDAAAAKAVKAALEASRKYGSTSPEARVAWDVVEEINASDNRYENCTREVSSTKTARWRCQVAEVEKAARFSQSEWKII
jgi:CP12 domain